MEKQDTVKKVLGNGKGEKTQNAYRRKCDPELAKKLSLEVVLSITENVGFFSVFVVHCVNFWGQVLTERD